MLTGFSGLRAIAAIIVIIYHLAQRYPLGVLSATWWGVYQFMGHLSIVVSLFFMLSGFFRAMSYWKVIDTPERMPRFFQSLRERFARIAPAYYVVLVLSFILSYAVYGLGGMDISAFLVGFSFLSWLSADTLFPVLLNGPLWFIAFDMMGWIFASLVMMGYMRVKIQKSKFKSISYWICIISVLLILHFAWISLPWPTSSGITAVWFPTYSPFLFALHFLCGIIAAGVVAWLRNNKIQSHIIVDIVLSMVVSSGIWWLWDVRGLDDWAYSVPRGPYHFPWVQGVLMVVFVLLPFSRVIGRLLDNRFFIFTASISYSLFLVHMLVMEVLRVYVFPPVMRVDDWYIYVLSTFVLSYLGAWLIHRYIETPWITKR